MRRYLLVWLRVKRIILIFDKMDIIKFPRQQLKKGWQEAKYVALYTKAGIGLENGISVYGKIEEVQSYRQDEAEYVRLTIEVWRNTKHVIRPVKYGIATYMMTTLTLLNEARELPELYMKNKQETTLWRMLRRISDHIKMELDHVRS